MTMSEDGGDGGDGGDVGSDVGGDVGGDVGEGIEAYSETGPESGGEIGASSGNYGAINSPSSRGSSYQDFHNWAPGYLARQTAVSSRNPYTPSISPGQQQNTADLQKLLEAEKKPEEQKKPEEPKTSTPPPRTYGGPSQTAPPSNMIPRPMPNITMPTVGAGPQKLAFFKAQADTLQAMLPYWKATG
jgi:hypothetical protein